MATKFIQQQKIVKSPLLAESKLHFDFFSFFSKIKMQNNILRPSKHRKSSRFFFSVVKISGLIIFIYLLLSLIFTPNGNLHQFSSLSEDDETQPSPMELTLDHIVFGIASNRNLWPQRKDYVKLWWRPNQMRGCVFLERIENTTVSNSKKATTTSARRHLGDSDSKNNTDANSDRGLPPVCISSDTSRFPYTYWGGLRSAIRVARVVTETVELNHTNVKWFVFGDDDTVFFPDNLVKTLSKYDHRLWYYVGMHSESFIQNRYFSYNMAFGGAGFAISYPLAKVLVKVLDSCLMRYPHLYGSDGRISSCIAELGVTLTLEPGFHQMDISGDVFGLLAAHPLTPVVSLHHLETTNPIFPKMNITAGLKHLHRAAAVDPHRLFQQTVCYDSWFTWTVSITWGYGVQIYDGHVFLPEALRARETFNAWKAGTGLSIDSREDYSDPCRRPAVFYLDRINQSEDGVIRSSYKKMVVDRCGFDMASPRKLDEVRVLSRKMEIGIKQLRSPRRHCCDVLPSSAGKVMELEIRECKEDELIRMRP